MPKATATPEESAAAVITAGEIPERQLVSAAIALKVRIKEALAELAAIERKLLACAPGKHAGLEEGHLITVFATVPGSVGKIGYQLEAGDEEAARALAGEEFGNLFDRHVSFTPCDGFEKVAPKLLTPAKAAKLLTLCAFTGKGYSGRGAYVEYPAWCKPAK